MFTVYTMSVLYLCLHFFICLTQTASKTSTMINRKGIHNGDRTVHQLHVMYPISFKVININVKIPRKLIPAVCVVSFVILFSFYRCFD